MSALSGCRSGDLGEVRDASQPRHLTFNQDIAPIVFEHCTSCHRPGQQSPLPLLDYQDVRDRAGQVLVSLRRRTMPPWLPEPGFNEFLEAKLLLPEQIAMFRQWVEDGAPEGAPDPPPLPTVSDQWHLGEPDMVVRAPQPYTLQADGADVVRNLVIPVPVTSTRYVRAMEFRPDNSRILRHAVIGVDHTPRARALDARDREPGYPGMLFEHIESPRDRLRVWVPESAPWVEPEGMAWRLEPGSDLVIQLQLRPTRAPEMIQPSIALFFSSTPPVRDPVLIKLESTTIDIPAGSRDHTVVDTYVLPVNLRVLSAYPHAHSLAKEMRATATLPDGTMKWLLLIKEWDSHWAEQYRYASPVELPRGTTLKMEFVYDNSDANMRNPHYPPRRVRWGVQPTDEMGILWLQVLPHNEADAGILLRDYQLGGNVRQTAAEGKAEGKNMPSSE
jgi:hypothetical protein